MSETMNFSRRQFLETSGTVAGGLILGFHLPSRWARRGLVQEAAPFAPNAFVRIATDETVTIIVNKSEMGQGVFTSLPMLIAEELDADWQRVRVEQSPAEPAYAHPVFQMMITGGSTSVASSWQQFRQAGATARALLVEAAAQEWGVPADRRFLSRSLERLLQRRERFRVLVRLRLRLAEVLQGGSERAVVASCGVDEILELLAGRHRLHRPIG